jgi:hypothetical protein
MESNSQKNTKMTMLVFVTNTDLQILLTSLHDVVKRNDEVFNITARKIIKGIKKIGKDLESSAYIDKILEYNDDNQLETVLNLFIDRKPIVHSFKKGPIFEIIKLYTKHKDEMYESELDNITTCLRRIRDNMMEYRDIMNEKKQ